MVGEAVVRMDGALLTVCTANVCRSPLAELLLSAALPDASVGSAGVHAAAHAAMCPVSASVLPGEEAVRHGARLLTAELIRSADLVLTMEREHRSAAVRLAPGSQAKVFTLREAAALVRVLADRGSTLPADLPSLAAAMHAVRGLIPIAGPARRRRWWMRPAAPVDPLTIVDGHGRDKPVHRAAVDQVARTVEDLLSGLRTLETGGSALSTDPA